MRRTRLAIGWMLLTALVLCAAPTGAQQPASQQGGPAAMVKDINPEPASPTAPANLVALGDTLFFTASDGPHGLEIWKSDGTAAGTAMVKDVNPNGDGIEAGWPLTASGGAIYFRGRDEQHGFELWRSDGTAAGTQMVKDINPGAAHGLFNIIPFNDGVLLVADDGAHGAELWRSDGTAAGTQMVREIYPGPETGWPARPVWFAAADGWMYFNANDSIHGRELWRTDGFSATTTLVKDIRPGAEGSDPEQLLYVEGALHFAADDRSETQYSKSIWTSDGTAAGTREGRPVDVGAAGDQSISLYNIGGRLYYTTSGPSRFTGTLHGPELYKILTGFGDIVQSYGRVFFVTGGFMRSNELWQTDGTNAGTTLFKELPGEESAISELAEAAGWLFLAANDGQHGMELWQSAGSPAGTAMIQDINPGAAGSHPRDFTLVGSRLYFTADDGQHGRELWSLPLGPRWANRLFAPLLGR